MAEYKNIMVYVETAEENPVKVGLEMLSPAKEHAEKVTAVVIGSGVADAAKKVAEAGADQVICVDSEDYKEYNLDAYAAVLTQLVKDENPEAVFIGGTQDGKDIAPAVAAKLGVGCASDVLAVKAEDGEIVYTCPLYGGTVLEDVKIASTPQVATLRSGAFQKVENPSEGEVVAKEVKVPEDVIKAKITESVKEIAETINLEEAEVIVSGGRGMGSKENFALVEELANILGGVVGATRPAIEDGWVSKIHQVGQSGKIVAPKLYIACGISGATQHVSGIMNSGYIVAINKDEDAPIFDVANVGIVGDVMKVLPVMIEEIKKIKDIPVIMLSARGEEYDKLFGFELGIDDYVVKPFSPKELMARINVILSRKNAGSASAQGVMKFGGLEINIPARTVTVDGQKVDLTPKEYDLLFYLVENRNIALSRDKLLSDIWGYDFFGDDRTIDTHIKNLRNNLGPYRDYIVTLRGVGYKFEYEG